MPCEIERMERKNHLLPALILLIASACSSMHQVSCTDFSSNPSFSYKKKSHHSIPKFKNQDHDRDKSEKFKEKEEDKEEVTQKKNRDIGKKEYSKPFKPTKKYKKHFQSNGCK